MWSSPYFTDTFTPFSTSFMWCFWTDKLPRKTDPTKITFTISWIGLIIQEMLVFVHLPFFQHLFASPLPYFTIWPNWETIFGANIMELKSWKILNNVIMKRLWHLLEQAASGSIFVDPGFELSHVRWCILLSKVVRPQLFAIMNYLAQESWMHFAQKARWSNLRKNEHNIVAAAVNY